MPLILVDFQPEYQHAKNYNARFSSCINYINKTNPHTILAFYNGDEVSSDTLQTVQEHYFDFGLDEQLLYNIQFHEKTYAFFRNYMDQWIPEKNMIKVIRYLVMNRLNDAREISPEDFIKMVGEDDYEARESIYSNEAFYIPEISISMLKALNHSYIGGGGEHECLKEIQLLMNAFNIKYTPVTDWIY